MTSPSPQKPQVLYAVIALLGALATLSTAILGSGGFPGLLESLREHNQPETIVDQPEKPSEVIQTTEEGSNYAVGDNQNGCVVIHAESGAEVNCGTAPVQSPPSVILQPPPLNDLQPGGSLIAGADLSFTAPKSWCLAQKDQWTVRNERFGKDDESIRASLEERNCASHGVTVP